MVKGASEGRRTTSDKRGTINAGRDRIALVETMMTADSWGNPGHFPCF
jgi:hypothetical protein